MIRILFTGGGTGGHIYPILAVAEELQIRSSKNNLDLRYFGSAGNYQYILATNGILVSNIISVKFRRYFDLRNFLDILIFPISLIQAFWKVFWFMPGVLFSKGGPGALPVVLACKFYRIPIIIHESDSIPGFSNQISARFADRIAVSFNEALEFFVNKYGEKIKEKIALIGNPIRRSLFGKDIIESKAAKGIFGFDYEKPLILVLGGSQGAARINDFILEVAPELIKNGFQILHQTGAKNFENVKNEMNLVFQNLLEQKGSYKIVPYFEKDLKDAYVAADLVVSRAGSGSIFEIAAFGKPAILIPIPKEIVGEHQIKNAYEYAKSGIFMVQLKKIFSDLNILNSMAQSAKNFSRSNAAKIIAEEIIKITS